MPSFTKTAVVNAIMTTRASRSTDLKADSKVQACIECHKKCGEAPKGKDAPKLDKKQKLEYHSEAFHDNCIGCHKEFNKEFKPKKAPVTCNDCHPKKS